MSEVAPNATSAAGAELTSHTAPAPRVGASEAAHGFHWRQIAGQATLLWLATRVAFALLTGAAFIFTTSGPYVTAGSTTGYDSITPHLLIQAWLRWDAPDYLGVAAHGYAAPHAAAFFPLYPVLVAALGALLGASHQLLAALIVSNLGALAAFVALALLAAYEAVPAEAEVAASRAVRMLAIYPFAFVLAAPYADGVFVGLALWALLLMRRGDWAWAALCVFLATMTRLEGLILVLPLLYEYHAHHRSLRGLRAAGAVLVVAFAAPVGLALYAAYLAVRFGQPLAFLQRVSLYWHYTTSPLWATLPYPASGVLVLPGWGYGPLLSAASLALFGGGAILTLATLRRMPFSFALYSVGLLLAGAAALVFAPDAFRSPGVYLVAAAPLFLLLGRWSARRPGLDTILVVCGLLLQAALALVWLAGLRPV